MSQLYVVLSATMRHADLHVVLSVRMRYGVLYMCC